MGRAKLNMELISKEKSRNITFKKRKEGLVRKIHEFTILCDVSACMVIYGPKNKASSEPEIWPKNIDEVGRIIEIYKSKGNDSGNKTFDLSDFFKDRQRKIEEELAKLRKKNMEAKYPTSLDFNQCNEGSLRELAIQLSTKLGDIRKRIESLKMKRQSEELGLMDFANARLSHSNYFYAPGLMQSGMELEVYNKQAISQFPVHHPIDRQQEMISQNSMMMLLMNGNDRGVQFGGGPPNDNIQCASFKSEVFYEPGRGLHQVDPFLYTNSIPMCRYYGMSSVTPQQYITPSQSQSTMHMQGPQSITPSQSTMHMQGTVLPVGVPQLTFGMNSYIDGVQEEEFF